MLAQTISTCIMTTVATTLCTTHTTTMLHQFQIDMLAVAAQHEGRIVQIFTLALMHNDFDTVKYIAANYLTSAHFTDEQITNVRELLVVIAELEATIEQQQATVH